MALSLKSIATAVLKAVAWLFLGVAGLAFLWGGGLIHAEVGTNRMTAELEGIALAILCAGVGVLVKIIAYWFQEGDLPASLGEPFRK